MVKRKGPKRGKKRKGPMTRRDPVAKKARRNEQDDSAPEPSDDEPEADDTDGDSPSSGRQQADSEPPSSDAPEVADDEAPEVADDTDDDAEKSGAEESQEVPDEELADWVVTLRKLDSKWTWIETRILFVALLALTVVLCFWIGVRGMSEALEAKEAAGTVFRAMVGMVVLGSLARLLARGRLDETRRNQLTVLAIAVGAITAPYWRGVGIDYFQGLLAWLQEGSSITLFGGLKGVSTRLTMLVALLGASLAAASGTHINIDVVIRFIPKSLRLPVSLMGAVATAVVCVLASYGFLDYIAVTSFKADHTAPMSQKVEKIGDELGDHFFILRKQASLDVGALPHVLLGGRFDDDSRMNGREWNTFVDEGGFAERYGKEKVESIRAPEDALDAPRLAFVAIPDGNPRGLLVHGMDLVFPFGFFMIALRVLLRALMVLGGAVPANPHEGQSKLEDEDDFGISGSDSAEGEAA